uniref:EF-hand domain-containing protein n=1 Tax=Pyrodinium bahamense TaxID=73915 RepID=A0A7S0FYH4_9DINO
MYVFAIIFTQSAVDYMADTEEWDPALDGFWGGLEASMLTLFKSISGGLSWHEVLSPLADISRGLVWLFCGYIFFTYFAVLNVVTGVFCNSAIENAANDPEVVVQSLVARKKEYMKKVTDLFKHLDTEDAGSITLEELETFMSDETLRASFAALEIDTDDAWLLFKLLDTNKAHVVDIEEFVWGCTRLRGSATAVDMNALLHDSRWLAKKLSKLTSYVEEQFQKLQSSSCSQ